MVYCIYLTLNNLGQLTQYLRAFSHSRARFIEHLQLVIPIDHVLLFHGILIASTIAALIAIYTQIKALTLFSMHPLCMTIGTLIFVAEGIAAFRNRVLVETFSPIMANTLRTKVLFQLAIRVRQFTEYSE